MRSRRWTSATCRTRDGHGRGQLPDAAGRQRPAAHDHDAQLGAAIDSEADGQPNGTATGDDVAGAPDDEDGVTIRR